MIHTTVDHLERYLTIHPRLEMAAKALLAIRERPFLPGRHAVDGEEIYVNAAAYQTRAIEASVMEAHRKYIDVMLLLEGEERIAQCDLAQLGQITQPYDAAQDALLAEIPAGVSLERLGPGDVVILFPEDAHAPGLDTDAAHRVRKLIAKVRI